MLEALVATGVRRIEATSFVSPKAVPALADADQVAAELSRWAGVHWSALVANPRGAVRAVDAGMANLEYVVSASDGAQPGQRRPLHRRGGRRRSARSPGWPTAPAARSRSSSPPPGTARSTAARRSPAPSTSPGPRSPPAPTSSAWATPSARPRRCASSSCSTPSAGPAPASPLGVHFHDTRGTGQANALAAVQAGVTQLDSSIGGLGGCPFAPGASGNIATEELVYMLEESGVRTGLDLDAVLAAARGHRAGRRPRAAQLAVPRRRALGAPRRRAADATRAADAATSAAIVDPRRHAGGAGPLRLRRHRRHRAHRRRADRLHLPVVQLAVARPAAGGLRPGAARRAPGRGCAAIGRFCVNVLAEGQDDVSQNFARSGARQVRRGAAGRPAPHGSPVLDDVVAWIDGELWAEYDGGDHTHRRRPGARPRRRPRPPSAALPPRRLRPAAAQRRPDAAQPKRTASSATSSRWSSAPLTAASHSSRGSAPSGRGGQPLAQLARCPGPCRCPGRSISPSV